MVTIEMLRSQRGSNDGKTVEYFQKGWKGEVSETLGKAFVHMGVAKRIRQKKAVQEAPENK